jgi:glutaredoxin
VELKVFTLPSCSSCPVAKNIASEVAQELGIAYREVNMATKEGMDEGLTYQIMGAPSIVIEDEVITRGRLVSKEKLAEEVKKRLEKWKARASTE